MKYKQRRDDQPWAEQLLYGAGRTKSVTMRWSCCDCGLVHDIKMTVTGSRMTIKANRNARATAAKRRKRKRS